MSAYIRWDKLRVLPVCTNVDVAWNFARYKKQGTPGVCLNPETRRHRSRRQLTLIIRFRVAAQATLFHSYIVWSSCTFFLREQWSLIVQRFFLFIRVSSVSFRHFRRSSVDWKQKILEKRRKIDGLIRQPVILVILRILMYLENWLIFH